MSKEFTYTDEDYSRVARHIYKLAGISLGESRREMVYSRLSREIRRLGLPSVRSYLDYLDRAGDAAWAHFVNLLTTNLTSFFRESHHFTILKDQVLPAAREPVRIWSCACATGEEPYSIAIACAEYHHGAESPPVSVIATDINTAVIQEAERGIYARERVEGIKQELLRKYFLSGTGAHEEFVKVKPGIRRMVAFSVLNLMHAHWNIEGKFDAIFCRNVMIYFDKSTQYKILERFEPMLKPHGLLFAGHSESFFNAKDLFVPTGKTTYRPARLAVQG
jgi:chemotaxis protein methyltransferase CheR